LQALNHLATQQQCDLSLCATTLSANAQQQKLFLQTILSNLPNLKDITLGFYGLAFKSGTDDLRASPGLWLAEQLIKRGTNLVIYDPLIKQLPPTLATATQTNAVKTLLHSDALIITHYDRELQKLTPAQFAGLKTGYIFDGRNNFGAKYFAKTQLQYLGIGL
jgi:UDPglucose 6-dehydrogenase